jgi:two-component system, OmpR family, sensor histidine kinase KdpD
MTATISKNRPIPYISWAKALGIWALCAVTLWTLELKLRINVDNLSIGLILAAALSSIYLTPLATFLTTIAAWGVFSMLLIPPIGSVKMNLLVHQELLIFTSLTVAILVGIITSRLRQMIDESQEQAARAHQLTQLGERMRGSAKPLEEAPAILTLIERTAQARGAIWCQATPLVAQSQPTLAASHIDPADLPALLESLDSFVLHCPQYIKVHGSTMLLLPIRGAQHQFGMIALALQGLTSEQEIKFIDEAIISLDLWAKSIEIAWQSLEVQRSKELAYQRGAHSALLSAISHEFRTPLSTILMSTSSLIEQKSQLSESEKDDRLKAIGREARQLRSVTHHILELSRLESGQGTLQREWASAEELIGIAVRRFAANHPGQEVVTEVAPALPLFECDQVLVLQLLENLLENASRHAGPQAPEIHAWKDAKSLFFAVRDQGKGVQSELVDTLFMPYQTRERLAKESPGQDLHQVRRGFGLGLPLCRAIARAHGGDVTLEYSSKNGAGFLVALPLSTHSPKVFEEAAAT